MSNLTRQREDYTSDINHVRRLRQGLAIDKALPANIRDALITGCTLIIAAIENRDDVDGTVSGMIMRANKLIGFLLPPKKAA